MVFSGQRLDKSLTAFIQRTGRASSSKIEKMRGPSIRRWIRCLVSNELMNQWCDFRNTDGLILKEIPLNATKSRSTQKTGTDFMCFFDESSRTRIRLEFLTRLLSKRYLCGNQGGDVPRRKVG